MVNEVVIIWEEEGKGLKKCLQKQRNAVLGKDYLKYEILGVLLCYRGYFYYSKSLCPYWNNRAIF